MSSNSDKESFLQKTLKKLFQDSTGKYVAGQPPNIPIYLLVVGVIGENITSGAVQVFFDLLASGAMFTWAFLEVAYGESLFRRILGAIVMMLYFVSRIAG